MIQSVVPQNYVFWLCATFFEILFNKPNLGKLVENNWSEILGGKLVEKQLAKNSPAKNSSQE